jgi:hypothetical protein
VVVDRRGAGPGEQQLGEVRGEARAQRTRPGGVRDHHVVDEVGGEAQRVLDDVEAVERDRHGGHPVRAVHRSVVLRSEASPAAYGRARER